MEIGLRKEDSAALKGIAVCMMVFHHCYRTADKFQNYQVILRGFSAEQLISVAGYMKICVAIFAFVSGYGLMYGYSRKIDRQNGGAVNRWTLQHLISTMSGYWFAAVCSYIVYSVLKHPDFQKWGENLSQKVFAVGVDIFGLSKLMGTKSLNGSWWYMSAAVIFVLLVPVLAAALKKFGPAVCIGLIFVFPRITGIQFPGTTSALSFLISFMLGMICCQYHFFDWFHRLGQKKKITRGMKFFVLFVFLCLSFMVYHRLNLKVLWEFQYDFVPFLLIVFCVEYVFKILPVSLLFQYLGKHSMNIWLVHTFVRDWLGEFVFGFREFWLIPMVILVISLLISYIIELLKKITGYDRVIKYIQLKLR